jgi:hypothetical protein
MTQSLKRKTEIMIINLENAQLLTLKLRIKHKTGYKHVNVSDWTVPQLFCQNPVVLIKNVYMNRRFVKTFLFCPSLHKFKILIFLSKSGFEPFGEPFDLLLDCLMFIFGLVEGKATYIEQHQD